MSLDSGIQVVTGISSSSSSSAGDSQADEMNASSSRSAVATILFDDRDLRNNADQQVQVVDSNVADSRSPDDDVETDSESQQLRITPDHQVASLPQLDADEPSAHHSRGHANSSTSDDDATVSPNPEPQSHPLAVIESTLLQLTEASVSTVTLPTLVTGHPVAASDISMILVLSTTHHGDDQALPSLAMPTGVPTMTA
jgi:hypothetical protein